MQRSLLINNTLEANRVYAAKLAEITDVFLDMAQDRLVYSAGVLSNSMDDSASLKAEVRRLSQQADTFNSVVIVDAQSKVLATSPEALALTGKKLESPQTQQALEARTILITEPFVSDVGNYLISISNPIFSVYGEYLGYVAGTIYLQEKNILNEILGKHNYSDGSYLYVVDRNKTLIYSPQTDRIGEILQGNGAVDQVVIGSKGASQVLNSKGVDMLAGFAPINNANWGVIAQRSESATLSELNGHILMVFIKSIPLVFLTLLGIWFSAVLISKPLWQLARNTQLVSSNIRPGDMSNIYSWYFEAAQLKRAIIKSMGLLNDRISKLYNDSQTDALTGLLNRRGMQQATEQYEEQQQDVSVIALDIDHFKRVNDTYGHDMGDRVIESLASLMKEQARKGDALCRSGGEEFLVFLPNTPLASAYAVAERLRIKVENTAVGSAKTVTISLGVSHWSGAPTLLSHTVKEADKALYQAKQQGRNRTVIHK